MAAKIIRIIARLNVGGPAKHVVWLSDGLDPSRFETLLVAGTVPQGEGDMSYFAEQAGVVPHIVSQMSREISFLDVVTVWKLYRLFMHEKPAIVHTHTAKAGTVGRVAGFLYRWTTLGVLVGRPRKCKFVHTYHGHIFHSYYSKFKTRVFITIEQTLARLATDRIVAISEQQGREICGEFGVGRPDQITVIPLGLDLDIFRNSNTRRQKMRDELKVGDDTILVGIVGRLAEIKNHQLFLEAVSRLKQLRRSVALKVRFVIIGDGSLRKSLEEQSSFLGLHEEMIFAGERNDPECFYPAVDVVALTSLNEGTPLTLIEAMANARPVISTNVGGVVDLLGSVREDGPFKICERGISVPAGDAEAFAAGLARLAEDPNLREDCARRGYEFVHSHYPKTRLLGDIANLYDELLKPGPEKIEAASASRGIQSRV